MKKLGVSILFLCFVVLSYAQEFRGMSVLSDSVVWISGKNGAIWKTINGGVKWDTVTPRNYKKCDFRDIHVVSATEAIVMNPKDSAMVLYTTDGGQTWVQSFKVERKGAFLDAFDFTGQVGVMIGDPYKTLVPGSKDSSMVFDLYLTDDMGRTWYDMLILADRMPTALKGEALFAASGSVIQIRKGSKEGDYIFIFVTGGGPNNRIITVPDNKFQTIPLKSGDASGVYSFWFDDTCGVAVGGNFLRPLSMDSTASWYNKDSARWELAWLHPKGYRSSVAVSKNKSIFIATGPNGTDISFDKGKTWIPLSKKGYNVCAFSKNYLWLAGNTGAWQKIPMETLLKKKKKADKTAAKIAKARVKK